MNFQLNSGFNSDSFKLNSKNINFKAKLNSLNEKTPISNNSNIDKELCSKKASNAIKSLAFTGTSILVEEDDSLFPNTDKKPELSLDKYNPKSLMLVHMTNYFPENGKILSTKQATKDENGNSEYRSTVHFALNKSVTEHALGNSWNTMNYAILAPFETTLENNPDEKVLGGTNEDFFFQDEVKLPKGSIILKFNPDIPKGKLKIVKGSQNPLETKGIKLIETSNPNMGSVATKIVKKAGYESFEDAYKKELNISDDDYELIKIPYTELNEEQQARYFELMFIISAETTEYNEKLVSSWNSFTKDNGYFKGLHTVSPWGRSEGVIMAIHTLKLLNQKWNSINDVGKKINYKEEFIKVLEESEDMLPKGKKLSFDVEKLKEIILKSETPKIAEEKIKKEMGLSPLKTKADDKTLESPFKQNEELFQKALYEMLDSLLCLSDTNKKIYFNQ